MNIAVIFAGGVGTRMKSKDGTPKQFLKIQKIPILVWTLRNFQANEMIDSIVVVMVESHIDHTKELVKEYGLSKVQAVVPGGTTGQESIYHGLIAAKQLAGKEESIVLVHDGVRPFLESDLIERNIASVKEFRSAISCTPSKETVVRLDGHNNIDEVIDRTSVWLARAPQSFYLDDILEVHKKAVEDGNNNIIDSCTMMMNYGKKIHIVETGAENIKITTPEDYYVARGLIMERNKDE